MRRFDAGPSVITQVACLLTLLVVTPAGESVLIDSGNPGGRDAARIHKVATQAAGLSRIDHFVLTHFHADHFGGLAELAALMPVDTVHERDYLSR